MIIESSNINIFYPRILDIRRKFFDFERILESQFITPFQLLPVPDDAPSEIARITGISKNGHSNLAITQLNLSLNTNYDKDYSSNWDLCNTYLRERTELLYRVLTEDIGVNLLYTGLLVKLFFPITSNDNDADYLVSKFLKVKSESTINEVNLKVTLTKDSIYYINYHISNMTVFEGAVLVDQPTPLHSLNIKEKGISVILDINDRYAYNNTKGYNSSYKQALNIFELTNDIINNKIENVINGGIF